MAEISSDQCHYGDKQQGISIKINITIYFARSYITGVFLCHSMFNTMTVFSANWFKIPKSDMLIYEFDRHFLLTLVIGRSVTIILWAENTRVLTESW
jgi:uncharacterized membrane protein